MSRHIPIVAVCLCLGSLLAFRAGGVIASAAAATESLLPDTTPDPIADGTGDVARFFRAHSFAAPFKLMTAVRDETLGRRYYRVRIGPESVDALRRSLVKNWTWGRFNRAVYENDHSSRLPRSHNLPAWWKQGSSAGVTLMLAHGGTPNWYAVINADGEVNLMWVAR